VLSNIFVVFYFRPTIWGNDQIWLTFLRLVQPPLTVDGVDGRNPAPVEVGSLSHYLQGFMYTRIFSMNSSTNYIKHPIKRNAQKHDSKKQQTRLWIDPGWSPWDNGQHVFNVFGIAECFIGKTKLILLSFMVRNGRVSPFLLQGCWSNNLWKPYKNPWSPAELTEKTMGNRFCAGQVWRFQVHMAWVAWGCRPCEGKIMECSKAIVLGAGLTNCN